MPDDEELDVDSMSAEQIEELLNDDGNESEEEPGEEETGEEETGEEEPKKQDTVPHARFHHERERRKTSEQETQRLRDRVNQMDGYTARQKQEEEARRPQNASFMDQYNGMKDEAPFEAGDLTAQRVQHLEQAMMQRQQQDEQQHRNAQEQAYIANEKEKVRHFAGQQFAAAAQETPGLVDQYNYLFNNRMQELMQVNGLTPVKAQQYAEDEELQRYHEILKQGGSISEHISSLAQLRGYRPEQQNAGEGSSLAAKAETQKKAKSLGRGGGDRAGSGKITPAQFIEMSDKEVEAVRKKYGEDYMDIIMAN